MSGVDCSGLDLVACVELLHDPLTARCGIVVHHFHAVTDEEAANVRACVAQLLVDHPGVSVVMGEGRAHG